MSKSEKIFSIVLAAGASTRMKTSTSKLLHSLLGKPVVVRAFEQAMLVSKNSKPLFVLGHQRELVENCLKEAFGEKSFLSVIQDPPLGTGDAVRVALASLTPSEIEDSLFFIMGGDAVCLTSETLQRFTEEHQSKNAVLSFLTARLPQPGAYGRVIRSSSGAVQKIVEAKNANEQERQVQEINAGFYLIQGSALNRVIKKLEANALTKEFYLTDLVEFLLAENNLVLGLPVQSAEESYGINNQIELHLATMVLRDRILARHLLNGVCILDPQSVWIDDDVQIDSDVLIESGVHLRGKTHLGEGVRVGLGSVLKNARIGRLTNIKEYCVIEDSEAAAECEIGPFARIRPETKLEEKVKIGNFVEVKKTHMKKSSKANHLSYLGDTTVGESANIGAGTITCNYDGYAKAKTIIGDRVFVGSNTALVAPLTIGDSAVVGAGSVITKDIPADALSLARGQQENIESGAKRFREKREKK